MLPKRYVRRNVYACVPSCKPMGWQPFICPALPQPITGRISSVRVLFHHSLWDRLLLLPVLFFQPVVRLSRAVGPELVRTLVEGSRVALQWIADDGCSWSCWRRGQPRIKNGGPCRFLKIDTHIILYAVNNRSTCEA